MSEPEDLSQAERLIAECKNRIARQREVVANAFQKGHDTEVPISMLRALEASLRAFETHPNSSLIGKKGEAAMTGKNRIMIYGQKNDGAYVIEFKTAAGQTLAISDVLLRAARIV